MSKINNNQVPMMKLLIVVIMGFFLIGNVFAELTEPIADTTENLCRVKSNIVEATEQVTVQIQVPDTESKVVPNKIDMSVVSNYAYKLHLYNRLSASEKATAVKPTLNISKEKTKTIQVQKYTIVKSYYIDWKNFKIASKNTRVPLYKSEEKIESKLKEGFFFDESNGEFYTYIKKEKC